MSVTRRTVLAFACGLVLLGSCTAGCGSHQEPTTASGVEALVGNDVIGVLGSPNITRATGLLQSPRIRAKPHLPVVDGHQLWDVEIDLYVRPRPPKDLERDSVRLLRKLHAGGDEIGQVTLVWSEPDIPDGAIRVAARVVVSAATGQETQWGGLPYQELPSLLGAGEQAGQGDRWVGPTAASQTTPS